MFLLCRALLERWLPSPKVSGEYLYCVILSPCHLAYRFLEVRTLSCLTKVPKELSNVFSETLRLLAPIKVKVPEERQCSPGWHTDHCHIKTWASCAEATCLMMSPPQTIERGKPHVPCLLFPDVGPSPNSHGHNTVVRAINSEEMDSVCFLL